MLLLQLSHTFSFFPRYFRVLVKFKGAFFFCSAFPSPYLERIYSRTPLFRTRLIRSPRYFEGRSNALGFTLPLYSSPVISKPRYFGLFFHFPWDFEIAGFDCIRNSNVSRSPFSALTFQIVTVKTTVRFLIFH